MPNKLLQGRLLLICLGDDWAVTFLPDACCLEVRSLSQDMTVSQLCGFLKKLDIDAATIQSVREFDYDSWNEALIEIRIENKAMKIFERWALVR